MIILHNIINVGIIYAAETLKPASQTELEKILNKFTEIANGQESTLTDEEIELCRLSNICSILYTLYNINICKMISKVINGLNKIEMIMQCLKNEISEQDLNADNSCDLEDNSYEEEDSSYNLKNQVGLNPYITKYQKLSNNDKKIFDLYMAIIKIKLSINQTLYKELKNLNQSKHKPTDLPKNKFLYCLTTEQRTEYLKLIYKLEDSQTYKGYGERYTNIQNKYRSEYYGQMTGDDYANEYNILQEYAYVLELSDPQKEARDENYFIQLSKILSVYDLENACKYIPQQYFNINDQKTFNDIIQSLSQTTTINRKNINTQLQSICDKLTKVQKQNINLIIDYYIKLKLASDKSDRTYTPDTSDIPDTQSKKQPKKRTPDRTPDTSYIPDTQSKKQPKKRTPDRTPDASDITHNKQAQAPSQSITSTPPKKDDNTVTIVLTVLLFVVIITAGYITYKNPNEAQLPPIEVNKPQNQKKFEQAPPTASAAA